MRWFVTLFSSDHNCNSSGVMLYVRDNIFSNFLAIETKLIVGLYVELNNNNYKFLLNYSWNHNKDVSNQLDAFSVFLDLYFLVY